jgi:hypothetical protein
MKRARGLKPRLAVLLFLSALAVESAWAQETADTARTPEAAAPSSANIDSASRPGWLVGRQNRVANPFRSTPAPGTALQKRQEQGTRPLPPGIGLPGAAAASAVQKVPPNATANALGLGWTCNSGFRRQGNGCVEVKIPENATLDFAGHGWMCNAGFFRQGAGCVALTIPQNASVDATGRRWACNHGYRREGQACVAVVLPEHASLDKAGHAWVCNPGYQARGQTCIDDATARLQQQADRAVNARPSGKTAPSPSVTINSGENRQGRTDKAKVVIGRF